jgi:hypothetical protein
MHVLNKCIKYVRTDFPASVAQIIPGQWGLLSDNQEVDLFLFGSKTLNEGQNCFIKAIELTLN